MRTSDYTESLTKKREAQLHGLFWILFIYFRLVQFDTANPYFFSVDVGIYSLSFTLIFALTFYFNYLVSMPRIFPNLGWKRILLGIFIGVSFFTATRYFIEEFALKIIVGYGNYFEGTPLSYYIYDNLYYASFPLIISAVFWILVFTVRLLEYNKTIEAEKRTTEAKFLRAQLNPHFMFNTLNNIYSLVYFKSDKALPAIEKLSALMRYTTYESAQERITLQKEIDYIQSYIALDQLRQDKDHEVIFDPNVERPSITIAPFILSPLVENALKHGKNDMDFLIRIDLKQEKRQLWLKVENKIGQQKKDKLGGVGLENLKRNLELHYPGKHQLDLTNDGQYFTATLEIYLDENTY